MSDIVPSDKIEGVVGASRHPLLHYGRAVSDEQRVYVLHSKKCLDSGIDLRDCTFSTALDKGINEEVWSGFEDMPVELGVLSCGHLAPLKVVS